MNTFIPDLYDITNLISLTTSTPTSKTIPENRITTTLPTPNGYANGKYITERMLSHAVQTHLTDASFARVDQIPGVTRSPGL
ncbi:NRPS-like enzyme [Penicillium vulpinum]|uniref:NRPS-like enzyme n=1 Tax=Penicillium vulpinum TaxID=29845 RepID=UPI0025465C1B|nr:NRPS-like enzyme [Penicillium vulpinum]KAJ5950943.1 NRPS-like enzyme [Penicillium vulpinum]